MRATVALAVALIVVSTLANPAAASWSSSASGTATARADTIVAPSGLTSSCTLLLGKSVTLNWSPANSWAGYEVRWGTSSGGPYPSSAMTTNTTYSTPALSSGTYYFVVRAINGAWLSANSNQTSKIISPLTCS